MQQVKPPPPPQEKKSILDEKNRATSGYADRDLEV